MLCKFTVGDLYIFCNVYVMHSRLALIFRHSMYYFIITLRKLFSDPNKLILFCKLIMDVKKHQRKKYLEALYLALGQSCMH